MRALTLTQPWAGLVASGIKLVENRSRSMILHEDFGVPFAIHASREIDEDVYARIMELAPELTHTGFSDGMIRSVIHTDDAWYRRTRITSAVLGIATIDSMLDPGAHGIGTAEPEASAPLADDQRRWFFGPIGYVLRDVQAFSTPVQCRGWQGFWHLTSKEDRERGVQSEVELAVLEQIELTGGQ